MSSNSKSSFGPAFLIRIGVLGALLLTIGGAYAWDRLVLIPAGEEGVNRVVSTCENLEAGKAEVHKAAGCEPTAVAKGSRYEVEDFEFSRILPNLQGYKVSVVYLEGKVVECFRGGISDSERATFLK